MPSDEAHRSHADKSLSEELSRVLGGTVKCLMYTGTVTDRCLRLFGERTVDTKCERKLNVNA